MSAPSPQRFRFTAMGSSCELQLYGAAAATAAQRAESEVRRLEAKYSRYRADSVTTRLNQRAGDPAGLAVDDETAGLLDYAQTAWERSAGLFDLTSGVLRRAWDFRAGRVPVQSAIEALLPRIGWQRVDWRRPQLVLPAGMELDFGGCVKEYAADAAARVARECGVGHGLVELGGDIALIGAHPDGAPWQIGIRDPRAQEHAIATVAVRAGAIASSGDYERFFEAGGRRYCHILNPLTGWPAQGLSGASVIADQCLVAGTATTVAMLKGADAGRAWLEELGLPYLLIAPDGTLSGSPAEQHRSPGHAAAHA